MTTTTKKVSTGEFVKFKKNGSKHGIYSQVTKKGLRYYYFSYGRYMPISKDNINKYIDLSE